MDVSDAKRLKVLEDGNTKLSCRRRFRVLIIVDDVTKECLSAIADVSLSGRRVIRELDHITSRRSAPEMIVSDN